MEVKSCFGEYDSSDTDCMFCEHKNDCKKRYEKKRNEIL